MKQLSALFLVLSFAAAPAFSASQTLHTSKSAPSSGGARWGLGVSTATAVTFTNTAFSAIHEFSPSSALHLFLAIERTSPAFVFGTGALYKYNIAGDNRGGFHIGGGLGLGTILAGATNVFGISIGGVAGPHFTVPGVDRLLISADAGVGVSIIDGSANFALGGLSTVLGLSIHYML